MNPRKLGHTKINSFTVVDIIWMSPSLFCLFKNVSHSKLFFMHDESDCRKLTRSKMINFVSSCRFLYLYCRHIYDWNIVNCDVKQTIQLNSTIFVFYSDVHTLNRVDILLCVRLWPVSLQYPWLILGQMRKNHNFVLCTIKLPYMASVNIKYLERATIKCSGPVINGIQAGRRCHQRCAMSM